MPELPTAKVFRSPKSSTTMGRDQVTTDVKYNIDGNAKAVDLNFVMGSSGGLSRVTVVLDSSSLATLITQIADKIPAFSDVLAEATSVATKRNLSQLKKIANALRSIEGTDAEKATRNALTRGVR